MKIFLNDKVYVSKHDVAFILREQFAIPYSVIYEIDNETLEQCDEYKSYLRHDLIEFTTIDAINYFKALTFIIDYDKEKDESISSLSLKMKFNYKMKKMYENSFPNLYVDDIGGIRACELEIEKFGHIIMSYDEIIKYKQGQIDIKIPEEENIELKHKKFLYNMFAAGKNEVKHEKIPRW